MQALNFKLLDWLSWFCLCISYTLVYHVDIHASSFLRQDFHIILIENPLITCYTNAKTHVSNLVCLRDQVTRTTLKQGEGNYNKLMKWKGNTFLIVTKPDEMPLKCQWSGLMGLKMSKDKRNWCLCRWRWQFSVFIF
jgi:hypothetical protein